MSQESAVFRCVYRAELKPHVDVTAGVERVEKLADQKGPLLTTSLFQWQSSLFIYAETVGAAFSAEDALGDLDGCLQALPGGLLDVRYWVPMMDIFHYSKPQGVDHWRRKHLLKSPLHV